MNLKPYIAPVAITLTGAVIMWKSRDSHPVLFVKGSTTYQDEQVFKTQVITMQGIGRLVTAVGLLCTLGVVLKEKH